MNFSKKLASLLLALTLLLAMTIPAMAASITIKSTADPDAVEEATEYIYYQIFDASIQSKDVVAYTIPAGKKALVDAIDELAVGGEDLFTVELSANGSVYTVAINTKSNGDAFTGEEVAEALNTDAVKENALSEGKFAQLTPGGTVTKSNLNPGYYLILSSLGTKLAVQTLAEVTITEKNEYPTNTKEDDKVTVSYGETVTYTVVVAIPANVAQKPITVVDTITPGLTMNTAEGAIKVTVTDADGEVASLTWSEGKSVEGGTEYTVEIPADTVFAYAGKALTLTYTATVNENAVVNEPEHNKAHIKYDHYTTIDRDTDVVTYGFTLKKIDGARVTSGMSEADRWAIEALDGAEFTLWTALTGGSEIKVVALDADGSIIDPGASTPVAKYRVAQNDAEKAMAVAIKVGEATIDGLAEGTYYLQEDKAPDGYNPLTERQAIAVSANTSVTGVDIAVENHSGAVMPSTGGMGTTILYVAGSILLVGAAVILIAKRRANVDK